jgi:hypothetical protein
MQKPVGGWRIRSKSRKNPRTNPPATLQRPTPPRRQSQFLFLPQVHDASPRVITQALALDVHLGKCHSGSTVFFFVFS